MNSVQHGAKYVGWSFDDLNKDNDKVKKIRDPLSVLILAAVFPFFKEGSKVSLGTQTLSVQHPDDYTYGTVLSFKIDLLRPVRTFWWGDNLNNLEVFPLNTLNATEYYDPVNNQIIRQLFEHARDGLPATKEAYKEQSTPQDAIDRYQKTIVKALAGKFKFDKQLSQAEKAVQQIWSEKEIIWVNSTISMMLENKVNCKSYDSGLTSILDKLHEKEIEFKAIVDKVKSGQLNTVKSAKPSTEPDKSSDVFKAVVRQKPTSIADISVEEAVETFHEEEEVAVEELNPVQEQVPTPLVVAASQQSGRARKKK